MIAPEPGQLDDWKPRAEQSERPDTSGWLEKALIVGIIVGSWANFFRVLL
jgi:hypothetical protein